MELNKAQRLAREMMEKHGLTDWSFAFDRAKCRFGSCRYKRKQITASRFLFELNDEVKFIDTILHEIAHALVGPGNGHNSVWKKKAIEIGSSGNRLGRGKKVEHRFVGVCPNCAKTVSGHKRRNIACGTCCGLLNSGKYSESFRFVWI